MNIGHFQLNKKIKMFYNHLYKLDVLIDVLLNVLLNAANFNNPKVMI